MNTWIEKYRSCLGAITIQKACTPKPKIIRVLVGCRPIKRNWFKQFCDWAQGKKVVSLSYEERYTIFG